MSSSCLICALFVTTVTLVFFSLSIVINDPLVKQCILTSDGRNEAFQSFESIEPMLRKMIH